MSDSISPLRDPAVIKLIVDGLKKLTQDRLDIDKQIVETAYIAKENNKNFSILDLLVDFKADWTEAIKGSRDIAAGNISGRLATFLDVKIAMVERINTMAKRQSAIKSLTAFAQEESPLVKNPLKGIDAVAKKFSEIWYAVEAESLAIVDVLTNATEENLKEIIQTLTKDLGSVKSACGEIGATVDKYATATPP